MNINTYAELIEFIKKQLIEQTSGKKKIVRFELSEVMFIKLSKLIKFYIRDNPNERFRDVEVTKESKFIRVKINGIQTIIKNGNF